MVKGGSPALQDKWSWGSRVGALDTEATRRPNVNASCTRSLAGGI